MQLVTNLYKKIIDNKKNMIIFIIILTLLSSISLFSMNLKNGHDILFHLTRIQGIKESFSIEFFPNIYSNYLNGYGYANPLFYPDIFLYIPAFLNYIGIDLNLCYKVFLMIINFFSILFIYFCVKGISKSKYAGVLASIIYAFASYRLVDVYTRAAIGEALAFVFAPLVVYGMYKIIYDDYKQFYILVIGMSGLILSHVLSTFIMVIALAVFVLLNFKKFIDEKQRIKYLIISVIVTLLITGYFLFPMLEQMISGEFLYNDVNLITIADDISLRAVPFYALFLELLLPLKYWIPAGIGLIYIYVLYLKFKNKKIKDKFVENCFLIGLLFLFLSSNLFPWKYFGDIFSIIQFPWRFYLVTTVFFTFGSSIFLAKLFKKKEERTKNISKIFILSLIPLISITTATLLSKNVKLHTCNVGMGEYIPLKASYDLTQTRGDIVISNNKIELSHKRIGNKIIIKFKNNYNDTNIELPLLYYKGYGAKLDDQYLTVKESENGLVLIDILDIDEGEIIVQYIKTPIIYISRGISIISIIVFLMYVYKKKKEVKNEEENI